MEEDKGRVCVSGGNGYLASWLIMRLLQRGYSVRATVRSGKDIAFLTSLPGASRRLKIYNADLDKPETFDAVIEGCIGVFHLAHPMPTSGGEVNEKLNETAISGTLGVLKSCLKSTTVKRVIYTSSSTTVAWNEESDDAILDENTWSNVDFITASKFNETPYFVSKIVTERAVLEFAKDHRLHIVSVIPPLVLGPFLTPNIPSSISYALAMILGINEAYEFLLRTTVVHVDDVANAHIHLFEHPHAEGRYICSSHDMTIEWLSEFLMTKHPELKISSLNFLKDGNGYRQKRLSSKKLLDSGFKFNHGIDEMLEESIQCCKEKDLFRECI